MTRIISALAACALTAVAFAQERLPAADNIPHFGKGQTEASLTLLAGKHTLKLVFADYAHKPFNPLPHPQKIAITVD